MARIIASINAGLLFALSVLTLMQSVVGMERVWAVTIPPGGTTCPQSEGDENCNQSPCTIKSKTFLRTECGTLLTSPTDCCSYNRYEIKCSKLVNNQQVLCGTKYYSSLAGRGSNAYCTEGYDGWGLCVANPEDTGVGGAE